MFLDFAKTSLAKTTSVQNPEILYRNTTSVSFVLASDANDILPNSDYTLGIWLPGDTDNFTNIPLIKSRSDDQSQLKITVSLSGSGLKEPGTWGYRVWLGNDFSPSKQSEIFSGTYTIYNCDNIEDRGCPALVLYQNPPIYQATKHILVGIRNVRFGHIYSVWFDGAKIIPTINPNAQGMENGFPTSRFEIDAPEQPGSYKLCLSENISNFGNFSFSGGINCDIYFKTPSGQARMIEITASAPTNVTPTIIESNGPGIPTPSQSSNLNSTFNIPCAKPLENATCPLIDTAIGEINTDPQGFVRSIFSLVLGLAGGIALILVIISGYRMMASQGNPEKIAEARQQLTSAVVGLLFIIFSFVILQVIGVDVLHIPGFTQ